MLDPTSLLPRPGEALLLLGAGALALTIRGNLERRRALGGALIVAFALASLRVLGTETDTGANQVGIAQKISLGIGLLGLGLILVQVGRASRAGGLGGWWNGPANWRDWLRFGGDDVIPSAQGDRGSRGLLAAHALFGLAALRIQHLHPFMLALVVSIIAGEVFDRRVRGITRPPLMLIATVTALGIAWYFLAQVAGSESLWFRALPEAPYSASFELGAALVLCLVAYRLLGLWPAHGPRQGPAAPLLGGILLVRLVLPVLPGGLEHWQPFLYMVVAVGAWHAALTRRPGEGLTALAGLGLLSGNWAAALSGLALVAALAASGLVSRVGGARRIPEAVRWLAFQGAGLIGLLLLLATLAGGLIVEVFYTVMTVSGVVALLWRVDRRLQPGHIHGSSVRDSSG